MTSPKHEKAKLSWVLWVVMLAIGATIGILLAMKTTDSTPSPAAKVAGVTEVTYVDGRGHDRRGVITAVHPDAGDGTTQTCFILTDDGSGGPPALSCPGSLK